MATRRAKRNKQRGMRKRLVSGKKPMSKEQKKANKILRDAQREANLKKKKE
jgi:hypothetical protein